MSEPKKTKKGLSNLLQNNKFVAVFSLVLAFSLWLWVAIEKSPEVEMTVTGVPVQMDLTGSVPEQLGLQIFGESKFKVDVVIKGKKFIVSSVTADDLTVTAQTNYVDAAGKKELPLKAVAKEGGNDFEILRLSQNNIEVFFDTYKEAEFAVMPQFNMSKEEMVPNGCILGNPVLSKSTVIVSGPASQVDRITGVTAQVNLTEPIQKTTTLEPLMKLLGEDAESLTDIKVHTGEQALTMTLPVLKKVTLPTTVTFKNAPAKYLTDALSLTVSPASVQVAVPVEKADSMKSISVGVVDFSEVKEGRNSFTFTAADVTDGMILDAVSSFKVSFNLRGILSQVFSVPKANISLVNSNPKFKTTLLSDSISGVTVFGDGEAIAALRPEMIFAELDLNTITVVKGVQTANVRITFKENDSCWAYGVYTVRISSTPMNE